VGEWRSFLMLDFGLKASEQPTKHARLRRPGQAARQPQHPFERLAERGPGFRKDARSGPVSFDIFKEPRLDKGLIRHISLIGLDLDAFQ
jgi:hypothetical protein